MDVRECILKRRSIRKFKDQSISDEVIKDLLECPKFRVLLFIK